MKKVVLFPIVYVLLIIYIGDSEILANIVENRGGQQTGPEQPFWAARGRRSDSLSGAFDEVPETNRDSEFQKRMQNYPLYWYTNLLRNSGDYTQEGQAAKAKEFSSNFNSNNFPWTKNAADKYFWYTLNKKGNPPNDPTLPFWAARG